MTGIAGGLEQVGKLAVRCSVPSPCSGRISLPLAAESGVAKTTFRTRPPASTTNASRGRLPVRREPILTDPKEVQPTSTAEMAVRVHLEGRYRVGRVRFAPFKDEAAVLPVAQQGRRLRVVKRLCGDADRNRLLTALQALVHQGPDRLAVGRAGQQRRDFNAFGQIEPLAGERPAAGAETETRSPRCNLIAAQWTAPSPSSSSRDASMLSAAA